MENFKILFVDIKQKFVFLWINDYVNNQIFYAGIIIFKQTSFEARAEYDKMSCWALRWIL